MLKVGTVQEAESLAFKDKVSKEVYQEALRIVTMLDENFGEGRIVDEDDGGFVLVIESKEDLADFSAEYVDISTREYVELLPTAKEPYFNVFILYNEYEFGITLLVPMSIVPENLLEEFMHETTSMA